MLKLSSLVAGVIIGIIFVGCGSEPKTDKEMIKESYSAAVGGDKALILEVVPKEFKKELAAKNIDSSNSILKRVELTTIFKREECNMDVDKIKGNIATIFIACGGFMNGTAYMKKDNGVWKVPVRE